MSEPLNVIFLQVFFIPMHFLVTSCDAVATSQDLPSTTTCPPSNTSTLSASPGSDREKEIPKEDGQRQTTNA